MTAVTAMSQPTGLAKQQLSEVEVPLGFFTWFCSYLWWPIFLCVWLWGQVKYAYLYLSTGVTNILCEHNIYVEQNAMFMRWDRYYVVKKSYFFGILSQPGRPSQCRNRKWSSLPIFAFTVHAASLLTHFLMLDHQSCSYSIHMIFSNLKGNKAIKRNERD